MDEMYLSSMMCNLLGRDKAATISRYIDKAFLLDEHFETHINQFKLESQLLAIGDTRIPDAHGVQRKLKPEIVANLHEAVDIKTLAQNTNVVLEGKHFLCRTIAPPIKMASVMTVVEDLEGKQAVRIAICNHPSYENATLRSLALDFPVWQVLLVKNPWFKYTGDGGYALHVDDPNDVCFVSDEQLKLHSIDARWMKSAHCELEEIIVKEQPQRAIDLKNNGNLHFVAGRYEMAVEAYTEGLLNCEDLYDSIVKDILCNRAAAYIALRGFQKALDDLDRLLSLEPRHVKGIYRKVKALCGLEKFSDAVTFVEKQLLNISQKKIFDEILENAKTQLEQQSTGQYDFTKFYTTERIEMYENVADFTGPVRISSAAGKGRGLFATRDIAAGELIILSKAFAIVFPEEMKEDSTNDFQANCAKMLQRLELAKNVTLRVHMDPALGNQVYALYAGSNFPPRESSEYMTKVDMDRICEIVRYNCFGGDRTFRKWRNFSRTTLTENSTGLWILPSYINHSCWDCNCLYSIYGNVMIVRAFREIAKGEEVLTSYVNVALMNRPEHLTKYGFTCMCRLCELDNDTSREGKRRIYLLKKICSQFRSGSLEGEVMAKLELLRQLNTLSLPRFNPCLVTLFVPTARHFLLEHNFRKCSKLLKECHALTENSPQIAIAMENSLNLVANFLMAGDVETAQKWVAIFKREVVLVYGTLEMARIVAKDTLSLMRHHGISIM